MKKHSSLTALLAVLVPCLATEATAQSKSFQVFEQFDAVAVRKLSKPWSVTIAGGTAETQSVPSPTNKSLALIRTSEIGEVSASRAFAPVRGRVVVEARVMSRDQNGFKALPTVFGSNNQKLLTIGFDGANIVCSDGQSQKTVQPFNAGEWYVLRVEIDTVASTYSLCVDAIKKVERASLEAPVPNVARVEFAVAGSRDGGCYFDNLLVYDHASLIGAPPTPVFDVTKYGAVGDGKTDNTAAIQKAIDACTGSGGSVFVPQGEFVSGTIRLKSDMTLFVSPDATLEGKKDDESYPRQETPGFQNRAVEDYRKAFIFAYGAKNLNIDGGGTIDGSGTIPIWRMNGNEARRPFLLFPVRCENLSVRNVTLKDSGMWCFVPTECTNVSVRNLNINSRSYGNRDGIDIVDCKNVLIENCTINTDDDQICPKSGARRGIENLTVRNCNLMGSLRANGIKFGTMSYGPLKNATFEGILIKNCDKAALALESVDGSDITNVQFKKIEIFNTNSPIYLIIGVRGRTPEGEEKKVGSFDRILFEDITGRNLKYNLGCPISGNMVEDKRYPLTNLTLRRCDIIFKGGLKTVPKSPPEMGTQYPECNLWGPLPAYGYYIRHADNVTFIDCKTNVASPDSREGLITSDVNNLK